MEVRGIAIGERILVKLQDINWKLCADGEEVHVHGRV